jgi:hypothetical protein
MRKRALKTGLFLLLASAANLLHADVQRLARYESSVDKQSEHRAFVSTSVMLAADNSAESFSILIREFGDQQIRTILLKDGAGHVHEPQIEHLPSGVRLSVQMTGSWFLTYEVDSVSGQMSRIPLPVASIPPPPGGSVVRISLRLAAGQGAYGDLFPNMTWSSPREGSATMLSVPSLIIVHNKEAGEISTNERLLTAANVANFSMLLLLALGFGVSGIKLSHRRRNPSNVEA